jgi:hypothetical protein
LGAPVFSAPGCGEREGLGVSVGVGGGVSSGLGVGDFLLCLCFVSGVGLGDGVGEIFFRLGEAVGDGLGVGFFAERFLCLRAGAGVGVGAKIFLIFVPNDSSAAPGVTIALKQIVTRTKIRRIILVAGSNQ